MNKIYNVEVSKCNDHFTLLSTATFAVAEQYLKGIQAFYDTAVISVVYLTDEVPQYVVVKIMEHDDIQKHHLEYTTEDQMANTFYRSADNPNYCAAVVCLPFENATKALEEAYQLFEIYKSIYINSTGYIYIHADGSIIKERVER